MYLLCTLFISMYWKYIYAKTILKVIFSFFWKKTIIIQIYLEIHMLQEISVLQEIGTNVSNSKYELRLAWT